MKNQITFNMRIRPRTNPLPENTPNTPIELSPQLTHALGGLFSEALGQRTQHINEEPYDYESPLNKSEQTADIVANAMNKMNPELRAWFDLMISKYEKYILENLGRAQETENGIDAFYAALTRQEIEIEDRFDQTEASSEILFAVLNIMHSTRRMAIESVEDSML